MCFSRSPPIIIPTPIIPKAVPNTKFVSSYVTFGSYRLKCDVTEFVMFPQRYNDPRERWIKKPPENFQLLHRKIRIRYLPTYGISPEGIRKKYTRVVDVTAPITHGRWGRRLFLLLTTHRKVMILARRLCTCLHLFLILSTRVCAWMLFFCTFFFDI